jgi:hypothetical protein
MIRLSKKISDLNVEEKSAGVQTFYSECELHYQDLFTESPDLLDELESLVLMEIPGLYSPIGGGDSVADKVFLDKIQSLEKMERAEKSLAENILTEADYTEITESNDAHIFSYLIADSSWKAQRCTHSERKAEHHHGVL